MNDMNMFGGMDPRQLAEALRRMGRGPDTVLAHITPREAARLKADGGSGTINPMTGLPEFIEYDYFDNQMQQEPPRIANNFGTAAPFAREIPDVSIPNVFAAGFQNAGTNMRPADAGQPFSFSGPATPPAPRAAEPQAFSARGMPFQTDDELRAVAGPTPQPPSFMERMRGFAEENPAAMRLAGAGANVLASALQARRARKQARQEAGQLREQAAPFRAAQTEAMGRARGGGLTPQQARALEIQQAQARQQLGARGMAAGSAAAGILGGEEMRARSQARQQSFDEALRLAGIADQYEQQAMKLEAQRDRETMNLIAEILQREMQLGQRTQTQPRQ